MPDFVRVDVYETETYDEYTNLYYSFDSSESVENTNEKCVSVFSNLKVTGNSNLIHSGRLVTAINLAWPKSPKDDLYDKVSYFADSIELLDSIGLLSPVSKTFTRQSTYALGLAACKIWGHDNQRMIEGLKRIAKACSHSTPSYHIPAKDKEVNPLEALLKESLFPETHNAFIDSTKKQNSSFNQHLLNAQASLFQYWMEGRPNFPEQWKTKADLRMLNDIKDTFPKYFTREWAPMMMK